MLELAISKAPKIAPDLQRVITVFIPCERRELVAK